MAEELCMDMGVAITDCVPQPVDTDIWTQVARHGPGQNKGSMSVTNRSIVYLLRPPAGDPFLVLLNGLWVDTDNDQPFKGLRALEAQTGAKLRYILSPGAGHHLSLHHYAKAFPEARVCVADGRIPRENAELMSMSNAEAYPPETPPAELGEAGLRILVLPGLMEGALAKRVQLMTAFRFGYVPNGTEPLMVLHEPTNTITSGGHQWWYVPPGHDNVFEVPNLMGKMIGLMGLGFDYMEGGKIKMETNGGFAVHDPEALQAACREVLTWEFDKLLDLHAQLDQCPSSGAKGLFEELMAPIIAGDWDQVPWAHTPLPKS